MRAHAIIPAVLTVAAYAQGTSVVTGAATYRERIALPPDAVFEAALEDVSRADAAAGVIGRTRTEHPGQPPFRFSIEYDPARVVKGHSYSVRARVLVGCKPMFITVRSYPVLTQGHGSQVAMMIMRRTKASPGGGTVGALGALPASYSGELPCADCPAIRCDLNLFPDHSYFSRMTYAERDVKPFDQIGRWKLSGDGATLLLSGQESAQRFAVKGGDDLRMLDAQGREIESQHNYDLRRTATFERIEPRLAIRGMFRYMARAASFTECESGQRWPVAMEGDYKALESAYMQTRGQPAEELLVTVEGQVAMRPGADGGAPTPTLVIERYTGIWPGETCAPLATAPLRDTYWGLTRLEGKPVILAPNQREPNLVFRSEQNRVIGFGGCNNLTGTYSLNGGEMTIGPVAATQMACMGMEAEGALFKALEQVRTWKILGQHLELYNAGGSMLARFEARALK